MDDRSLYTDVPAVPAATDAEQLLIIIWREILGVHPIGAEDNFLDLGGTSILAVRLTARIEQETGRRIPADLMLTAETLADVAREFDTPDAMAGR